MKQDVAIDGLRKLGYLVLPDEEHSIILEFHVLDVDNLVVELVEDVAVVANEHFSHEQRLIVLANHFICLVDHLQLEVVAERDFQ